MFKQERLDSEFMRLALKQADLAGQQDEVPIGAVLVVNNHVVARGHNRTRTACDPTAHAEVLVVREAAKQLAEYRLIEATLYVTVEPCLMCCGALQQGRIKRLVYGAREPKMGAVVSAYDTLMHANTSHRVHITEGVLEEECRLRMTRFFQDRR